MLRTEKELEIASQEMLDMFYPRKVYNPPCEDCNGMEKHKSTCSSGRSITFQGWQSGVQKTKKPQGNCQVPNCEGKAVDRIRLNIWGGLWEVDLCHDCATFEDGRSRDGICCDEM